MRSNDNWGRDGRHAASNECREDQDQRHAISSSLGRVLLVQPKTGPIPYEQALLLLVRRTEIVDFYSERNTYPSRSDLFLGG